MRALLLVTLAALLSSTGANAQNGALGGAVGPSGPLAVVLETSGDARVFAHTGGALHVRVDTLAASPLLPLSPRDRVVTGSDGRASLAFADPLQMRLEPGTSVDFVGQYDPWGYASREARLDSGRVTYAFAPEADSAAVPLVLTRTRGAGAARVSGGSGGVLVGPASFRIVVTEGEAEVLDEPSGRRLPVPAGSVGVVDADGLLVRRSTLAERDLVAEPTARRRLLLVPGTDDEGNARTFIIEWEE